jgi:hypothetical protein
MFDSLKNRLGANLKVTQLSYMLHPGQIVAFCRALSADEQAAVMKGIESTPIVVVQPLTCCPRQSDRQRDPVARS